MENCIFCKIVAGEVPCQKIYEDENYLAFLDIKQLTKGTSLVIPKKHTPSNFPDTDTEILSEGVKVAQKVAKMLQKSLGTQRVFLGIEGIEVNHLHFKLYPSHGKGVGEIARGEPIPTTNDELEKLAEKIRSN